MVSATPFIIATIILVLLLIGAIIYIFIPKKPNCSKCPMCPTGTSCLPPPKACPPIVVCPPVAPCAPCPTGITCPPSSTIKTFSPPVKLTSGGQIIAQFPNPGVPIMRFGAILQDTAIPPGIGVKVTLYDGPNIYSPILATLTTHSNQPVFIDSPVTAAAKSSMLTVGYGAGPGSNSDLGTIYGYTLAL